MAEDWAFSRMNPEQQQRTASYFEAQEQFAAAQEEYGALAAWPSEVWDSEFDWQDRQAASRDSSKPGLKSRRAAAKKAMDEAEKRMEQARRNMPPEAMAELIRRKTRGWEVKL